MAVTIALVAALAVSALLAVAGPAPTLAAAASTGRTPTAAVTTTSAAPAPSAYLAQVGEFVTGGEPKNLLADLPHGRLFVSDFSEGAPVGSISIVDLATGRVERRYPVPGSPANMVLSPDGRSLLVAEYWADKIVRLDLDSGGLETVITGVSAPWDIALVPGPGGTTLLAVTEHHADQVSFFNASSFAKLASIETDFFPYTMALDASAGRLYVASTGGRGSGQLMAVDLATLKPVWHRLTAQGAFDVQMSVSTGLVTVTCFTGQTVQVFGTDSTLVDSFKVPGRPRSSYLSPDGTTLYVTFQNEGVVTSYHLPDGAPLATVSVGSLPGPVVSIGADPAVRLAVGNQNDGTISVLSWVDSLPDFVDVPVGSVFYAAIHSLAQRGIVNGYPLPDGASEFWPDATLARAQLAKMLVGALGLHTPAVEPATVYFYDVDLSTGAYPFDYVQEAVRAGIAAGFDPAATGGVKEFGPYDPVTRLQLIRMVANAARVAGSPLPAYTGSSPFADVGPSDADYATILAAYGAGLISGSTDASGRLYLDPYAPATRGETAKVVDGLLGVLTTSGHLGTATP